VLAYDAEAPHGRAYLRADGPPGFAPEAFTLVGPQVVLDGTPVPWPPLTLRWPAGGRPTADYRSDAEQALLAARAEACRRETPQRACANLLEFGMSRSFAAEAAPLRWQGRWWRSPRRDGTVAVDGEMSVAPTTDAPWRLADAVIRLRDEAGGVEHALRIERLQVVFRDRIAMDTPLHAGRAAGAGASEVQIEALLPGDVPDFELRLPPLQVGTATRQIAPIRFERRRFDGGVEPFNC
jgi:hypothetical protein